MTPEEFKSEYEALYKQKQEIISKMFALEKEYANSLPFKVGDCVRIHRATRAIEKCWIAEIKANAWGLSRVDLAINKPRKDGTRSHRIENEICVSISEIELLNNEL